MKRKPRGGLLEDWNQKVARFNEHVKVEADSAQYAVNLADMLSADFPLKLLINPVLDRDHDHIITAEPERGDGQAILLLCPNEQAQAIIEIVRGKIPKRHFRFYKSVGGKGWKSI